MTNSNPAKVKAVRARLRSDFEYYAPRCLKIKTKPDANGQVQIAPFEFNAAQKYIHKRMQQQIADVGYVRVIILKGRQQGASTYTEGRFYWKTSMNPGEKTFIMTHEGPATSNLFMMVERYHKNTPIHVRPSVGRNNSKKLEFDRLDSEYQVATAGSKGAGRSATLTNVHGSEVAFWENGDIHLAGLFQAVPLAKGTEVVLESTANGVGDVFHKQWKLAENGESDFIAVFVPWFWQSEYARALPHDFQVSMDKESVPEGELTEAEYQEAYGLSDEKIYWRRMKIREMGGGETGFYLFQQEYPATPDEAFQSSARGNTLMSRRFVTRARKNNVQSTGSLIIGVDPGGDGEGGDPTGIIRRRGRRMFDPQLLTKINTMQLAALCLRIIKKERPVKMFIDVGGIGKGTLDRLLEYPDARGIVVPVNFGEAANDPETYLNRRAEMHWLMKEWLEDAGGANIPDSDTMQTDLLASVIKANDSLQRKQLKSKDWMRSNGIPSPNLADAGALTFALPVARVDSSTPHPHQPHAQDFDPVEDWGDGGQSASNFDPMDF